MKNTLPRGRWSVRCWEDQNALDRYRAVKRSIGGIHQPTPVWELDFNNGITDVGIHHLLDRFTDVGTPAAQTWYAGLIDNSGFSGVNASDTSASHTGWTENQDFDESVRQTLAFSAAASRSISDEVSFTMNASVTIQGLFVIAENTKGGTTGILFSTALFASAQAVISGNVLTANYSLSD